MSSPKAPTEANERRRALSEAGLKLIATVIADRQIDDACLVDTVRNDLRQLLDDKGPAALVDLYEKAFQMSFSITCREAYANLFGRRLPCHMKELARAAYREALTERFTALANSKRSTQDTARKV